MRINSVCVLGWAIFHQMLHVRAQTAPDNPLTQGEGSAPTPPDNPISLPEIFLRTKTHCVNLWAIDPNKYYDMITPEAQPFSLCPGKEVPMLHLTDGKAKKIWLTFGFPRPTATKALSPYAAPTWLASFVLPKDPGTIEVDENYCLNIAIGGKAKQQQCLQKSCLNRRPYNGKPVEEMNPYGLWNYVNDQTRDPQSTCSGDKGASIPDNTGQFVGFNSGDEYVQPTFQGASFSTESEGGGVVSSNGIVGGADNTPNVADRLVPVGSLGSNSIPESALSVLPGDPYSDSNNSPINPWDETVMDWNKKNKRAAKLARRKFLQGLHGSE